MNLTRPIHILLLGSTAVGLLILAALLIFQATYDTNFGQWTLIVIPLIGFATSYLIFYFLVEAFINKKIKVIYRIISNKKLNSDKKKEFSLTDNTLAQLTKDTQEWAATQKAQITQLEAQAEFRKEFLGNLAHELKTPVFSIQGYVLTLLEGGLEDENVNRQFLERALSGVDRITTLLEDLDDIARFESDRFNLKITKFDIVALTKDTFNQLASKADQKQINFEFNKEYTPIIVKGDKGKIAQVLTNLVSNSISYGTEEGTTTVRFHALAKNQILVEVADNGVGMDEKHFPRLFERFYRVDKSRERNVGGSGLGLAIVKHIVEAHGQTINVRSTEGIGSTFSFTLEKA
ncbi:MAG: ATP-binding protein [Flavobacteriales bacterium]|jgi:two-component system phosphate regulon sensor histidine kinase PhoR|nr:ATP-binding protein [Flavobacteriales bacterium]